MDPLDPLIARVLGPHGKSWKQRLTQSQNGARTGCIARLLTAKSTGSDRRVRGVMVSMDAFQAFDGGSIPPERKTAFALSTFKN
ncbi:unnamed protein product [Caenorhabditis sp. 36 PRJEB53466]|nr:unnamed protein product [Caenorhabditis sp. 36 PRJEB53466]